MKDWVELPEFPGYSISNDGQVYSSRSKRLLIPDRSTRGGYARHSIVDRTGKRRHMFASRLVLMAYSGPPFKGAAAAHLDGDQTNDSIHNLQWKTGVDNEADKLRHGTRRLGQKCHLAKLTDEQAEEALTLFKTGEWSISQLGKKYGVTRQAIWAIKERRSRRLLLADI